jgi:hypothetical protein
MSQMACVQTIEAIVQHGVSKKSLLDVSDHIYNVIVG